MPAYYYVSTGLPAERGYSYRASILLTYRMMLPTWSTRVAWFHRFSHTLRQSCAPA